MQRWKMAVALAVVLAAGACARGGQPTAPEAEARFDELQTPQEGDPRTPPDSSGRWGGYIGGGG